jgi:hypothetical protein
MELDFPVSGYFGTDFVARSRPFHLLWSFQPPLENVLVIFNHRGFPTTKSFLSTHDTLLIVIWIVS